jgi:nitrogen fixation NifU-like protein
VPPVADDPREKVEALYREVVLDHYRRPRNRRPLPRPDASAVVDNPVCGDQVKVEVALEEDRIRETSAVSRGCSIAVAAGSVMTELVTGCTREEVRRLAAAAEGVVRGRPVPEGLDPRLAAFARVAELPSRQRCALLAWEALEKALEAA